MQPHVRAHGSDGVLRQLRWGRRLLPALLFGETAGRVRAESSAVSWSCPECGFAADPAAFVADAAFKQAMAVQAKLPAVVQAQLVAYLGLFRPEKRSLTGARTLKIVQELAALVLAGTVDWNKQPPRRCAAALWAEGMRQMVERKAGQRAHFENHNYLRAVVYDLADQADREGEQQRSAAERAHRPPARAAEPPEAAPDEGEGGDPAARAAFFALVKGLSGKLGGMAP